MLKDMFSNKVVSGFFGRDVNLGVLVSPSGEFEFLITETTITENKIKKYVKGDFEIVKDFEDRNFLAFVKKNAVEDELKFNLFSYSMTGINLYGNVLFLRKDKYKKN